MKSKTYLMTAFCFACVVAVSSYMAMAQQQQAQTPPDSRKGMEMGEMHKRGDRVMGFAHDKTTHHFRLLPDGGTIQVEANDAQDIASRDQIRMHLSHIATMFADGNFKAPMLIHDQTPPGAPILQRLKAEISYKFENTDHGGWVRITTKNAEALKAIHEFLRFQIKEHQTGDPFEVGLAHQEQKLSLRSEMIVSTAWLAAHLNDPKVVILHVARLRAHYDEGHIPGARFAGWDEITATRDGVPNELAPVADLQKVFERLGIRDDARIVLYGDNSGLSAARAYFTLDYLGHGERSALLDGGLEKWKAERRAVSTDIVEPKTAQFAPRVRAGAVTDLDVVRDLSWTATNLSSPNAVLIDARPVDEYTGTKPGEGVQRGGHIPGAANVFWMQNVVSRENPALRSAAELRRLYEAAGVQPGRTIVTYCRTGGQASHAYFTLKYLGYDVVMYDGSFFEWSNTEGTPVVAGRERK